MKIGPYTHLGTELFSELPMDALLKPAEADRVTSPALLFDRAAIRHNIQQTLKIAGDPHRLRPHVKTHKTREIARLWMQAGVTRHKCATLAEAEMLATVAVPDVLIAYPIVGPNCVRLARLVRYYPQTRFGVTVDHPKSLRDLSAAFDGQNEALDVYLDVNCGMGRTGIEPGEKAQHLYREIASTRAFRAAGFHVYDGHNNQTSLEQRTQTAQRILGEVLTLRDRLSREGFEVSRIVVGGTPSFPCHASQAIPGLELSPGTLSLHDANYDAKYPELGLRFGAVLLTRVVSRPTRDRVTLDLGYKAVAPDSPMTQRCRFPDIHDAEVIVHSEEHMTLRTAGATRFEPGDLVYGIPAHVCPTVALHRFAWVVEDGAIVDRWEIAARDREITVG